MGSAYRVTQSATFTLKDINGELVTHNCEPGDLLVVVGEWVVPEGVTPNVLQPADEAAWTVLQNNIDLTAVLGDIDANADESKVLTLLRYTDGVVSSVYSQLTSILLGGYQEREKIHSLQ
jgi:hypothetical protein